MLLQLLEAATLKLLEGGIQEVTVSPAAAAKQISMDAVFHIKTTMKNLHSRRDALLHSQPAAGITARCRGRDARLLPRHARIGSLELLPSGSTVSKGEKKMKKI